MMGRRMDESEAAHSQIHNQFADAHRTHAALRNKSTHIETHRNTEHTYINREAQKHTESPRGTHKRTDEQKHIEMTRNSHNAHTNT